MRSGRHLIGAALLAAATVGCMAATCMTPRAQAAEPATPVPPLSEQSLLWRLGHPSAQLTPLPVGVTVSQVSSHDLGGGNLDGGSYDPALSPLLPPTYVRKEATSYVLADERGPGCLVRFWMTANSGASGNTASFGNLQLYFDGSSKPAVNEPVVALFAGKDPRFPRPLVDDYVHSSGGNYSYIPFCFQRRLQVRVTGRLSTMGNYFQLTFLNARPGTPVQSFSGGTATAQAAATVLKRTGRHPAGAAQLAATARVRPGRSARLPALHGSGTVSYLRVKIRPFDIATLDALSLRVTVGDARRPQVDVPLADVFGDGIETRPIRSLDFGMNPATQTGYLALPIPYRDGARIAVTSTGASARVSIGAWTTGPAKTRDLLFGRQVVTRTELGRDFPVLDAAGSGRLASYVMDIRDPSMPLSGYSPGQWFMEGDERVYVDGLRSPSIYGTGTEDEFNGGYYFTKGAFTLPFSGAGPLSQTGPAGGGAQSAYRDFGDDGVIWSDGLAYGQQAGGDDERPPETAVATTFSYRGPRRLVPADRLTLGSAASRRAHSVTGRFTTTSLDAFFEGDRDGTIPLSTVVVGGLYYASPPPPDSPEAVSQDGISFNGPVSATLRVPPDNHGVVLRRLQDQRTSEPVRVLVDGRPAGIWAGAAFQGDPLKRWLESDFELPIRLTRGHRSVVVTLRPAFRGETATAYTLVALTRH